MSHHGYDDKPPAELMKAFVALSRETESTVERRMDLLQNSLGPTGRFPLGKIAEEDAGETAMAVGHTKGKVFLNFGKPMSWIGFTPSQARQLAAHLMEHANAAPLISPDGTPERVFHGAKK